MTRSFPVSFLRLARRLAMRRALPLVLLLVPVLAGGFIPPKALAEEAGWQAVIAEHSSVPAYLVAVDKSRQELSFFERRSPLRLSRVFACTTGQAVGDKAVQGDLKTPEGIYFVGHRISSGLDFIKYGPEAYTLNYPNPVDRLRKKTGYGIWIHGRGEPLIPLQTEGCVSMNNEDLGVLARALTPGTPVALAGSLAFNPAPDSQDANDARLLEEKVHDWASLWSARSVKFFDLYSAGDYSLSTESFAAFRAQKERLFRSLPWIRTTVRDVQTLKGPGYWVSWFYQDYQAPNLSTRGVRRLYWGKNQAGEFKILGMEWQPGLNTSLLLASAEPLLPPAATDAGPLWSPEEIRLAGARPLPLDERKRAAQNGEAAEAPWTAPPGGQTPDQDQNAASAPAASAASAAPAASTPAAAAASASTPARGADQGSHDAPEKAGDRTQPRPSPAAFALAEVMNKKAGRADNSGAASKTPPSAKSGSGLDLPPPLPAQGLAASASSAAAPSSTGGLNNAAPAAPMAGTAVVAAASSAPAPRSEAAASASSATASPAAAAAASPAAAAAAYRPEAAASASSTVSSSADEPSLAELAEFIPVLIENWRLAWQSGDLDAYAAFYSQDALQGSRRGAKAIRRQKEQLWSRVPPAGVRLEDVRLRQDNGEVIADMIQEYRDAKGGGDTGMKTLFLRRVNGVWLIIREDWKALSNETGN